MLDAQLSAGFWLRGVLALGLLVGSALPQRRGAAPPGNAFLLSSGDDAGALRTLIGGDPVAGTLGPREAYVLEFAVRELNGSLPDVTLSVASTGRSGDADLECRHLKRLGGPAGDSAWASNHTSGRDYVFISGQAGGYWVASITVGNGERTVRAAAFSCSVSAPHVSEDKDGTTTFELSVVVDYTPRRLAAGERRVVSSIFDKCCKSAGDCAPWRRREGDLCHFKDNVCDGDGHLLRLSMPGFGLNCSFPGEEISNLTRLEKLELGWNAIGGSIEDVFRQLVSAPAVEHLGLSNNAIANAQAGSATGLEEACSGTMAGNLSFLDLRNNKIEELLSPCLFHPNSTLAVLHVDGNPLNGTQLPDAFSTQSKIRVLTASGCGIVGTIPSSVADARWQRLDLSVNSIVGTIPGGFGWSPLLEWVNMGRNGLKGMVPPALAMSRTLRVLWLHRNALSELPAEWIDGKDEVSKELRDVILARNQIQSPFPLRLAQGRGLLRFHIGRNFMGGPLPEVADLFPRAAYVDISRNVFVGQFPHKWGTIGMLAYLNGGQPTRLEWVNSTSNELVLPVLDISDNGISGVVNRFLVDAHLSRHAVVFLDGNRDMLCAHITGVPCDTYFDSGVNLAGQAAGMDPVRIDLTYTATMVPVAAASERPPIGVEPQSSSSPADHGEKQNAVTLGTALAASVVMILSMAAGLLVWRVKSRQSETAGGQAWKPPGPPSSAKDGNPTPRATTPRRPEERRPEDWAAARASGDFSSSSFTTAPSLLSARVSMTGQAATPVLTSNGSLPGSRAGSVGPALRSVPLSGSTLPLPPLRLPDSSLFFTSADDLDHMAAWGPAVVNGSPVGHARPPLSQLPPASPAGSSDGASPGAAPSPSMDGGAGAAPLIARRGAALGASDAPPAIPLNGRRARSWNGDAAGEALAPVSGKSTAAAWSGRDLASP